jgi:heat-inducible transcriptional repressor
LALQDRELLLSLLEKTELAEETRVLIGHEVGEVANGGLSVVSAPYTDQGRVAGTIGVVGLVRMDYSKVVTVVSATAKAMSAAYDRARRDSQ